jgi:isopenicillin-N epimerase
LYVTPERRAEVTPAVVSWWDEVGFPVSFDVPGTMDSSGWLASVTALDLMEDLDFAGERKRLGELVTAGCEQVASALGTVVADVGTAAPTMRLVELPRWLCVADDVAGNRLQSHLAARTGVETALTNWQGRAFLRLSAHLYNRFEDYQIAADRIARFFADRDEVESIARG